MDLTVLIQEFAKAGLLPLAMAIVIYTLWKDNVKWREDYNLMRDKMQDKVDAITTKSIEAINNSANQLISITPALASLAGEVTKLREKWLEK
jgi:hypothetical protein